MTGTIGGYIYATPTDHPLNWPATSQTLAQSLADAADTHSSRPYGTLGNLGTFNAAKPIRHFVGWSISAVDANGCILVKPPGANPWSCVLGAVACNFSQGTGESLAFVLVRVDLSSLANGVSLQARNPASAGAPIATGTRTGFAFDIAYQP